MDILLLLVTVFVVVATFLKFEIIINNQGAF